MINLYTIYNRNTLDFPGVMVMRRWEVGGTAANPIMTPKEIVAKGQSVQQLRAQLPPNCQNLGRFMGEDPNIVESWMQLEKKT